MVEVDDFLAERRIATLATENADGSSHLTAIWYAWEDGEFLVPTAGASRKGRNAAERPRAAILVDARGAALRGVFARGPVDVLRGDEARRANERIHRRYVTEEGMADPGLGRLLTEGDDVTLRISPGVLHSWDLTDSFGDRFADAALVYPLAE